MLTSSRAEARLEMTYSVYMIGLGGAVKLKIICKSFDL